jgi:integral membrane protein (TIGR01906 family)
MSKPKLLNKANIKYKNTFLPKILLFLIIISVFSIILFSSLFSFIYDIKYYDNKYLQYKIYDKFSKEQALNETKNLFGYLQFKNDLDMNFFNKQEESHLNDVKIIINKIYVIYFISLFIFWSTLAYYYFFNKRQMLWFFSRFLFYSGIFSLGILLLLGLFYLFFGFNSLFSYFHQIFFAGNYSFNPAVSNMKALFPDEFFMDIGIAIVLRTFVKGFLLFSIGIYFRRKTN